MGLEKWMSFAVDSPVRTYLPPEKASASAVREVGSGPSSPGSLAKFNPDLYGWKTAQCSLFGGLEWFVETWPRWGMMRDGELFPLTMPALRTCEKESGYSPIGGGAAVAKSRCERLPCGGIRGRETETR